MRRLHIAFLYIYNIKKIDIQQKKPHKDFANLRKTTNFARVLQYLTQ